MMYLCMHVWVHACMHLCMYVCTYVCMYNVSMHVYMYVCMHVWFNFPDIHYLFGGLKNSDFWTSAENNSHFFLRKSLSTNPQKNNPFA